MSKRSAIFISVVVASTFFMFGILVGDFPRFQCETKIRPFEALNFFVILLFGYWFQSNERKHTLKVNGLQKLLEQIYEELANDINTSIEFIEELPDGSVVDDSIIKKVQLKFKSISTNVKFIIDSKPESKIVLNLKFVELKDSFLENLILRDFRTNSEYLKEIYAKSMDLKNSLRLHIYDINNNS